MNRTDTEATPPGLGRQEISLLLELGKRLVVELDLNTVLTQVAEVACDVVQAETLAVPIIEADAMTYTYRAAYGQYAALVLGQTYPITEGSCGWVMRHRRPLLFGEGGSYELDSDKQWQPGMSSSLLVPLICRGSIIGGLSAMGRRGGGAFTQHDLTILSLFANQASIAIDNARLFMQVQREKTLAEVTLASIGDAVITTDAQGHVSFLNDVASELTGWPVQDAIGRPAAEIFHIIDEYTRERVPSPVDEVIRTGGKVSLSNHTLLIARDGVEYNIEDSAAPILTEDGAAHGCVLVFHDITEKHQSKKQLEWQAVHDVLTGLPNRVLLADRFQRALASARRNNHLLGVCMIDLDRFKPVNDKYGHAMGDRLLVQVTERLNKAIRNIDTIARLGGDEFALLLCDITEQGEMEQILERILDSVSEPYFIDRKVIDISASIGVSIYPMDDVDADTLLRHADQAMYLAKQAGRRRIQWFDVAHDRQAQASHKTLARLRKALEDHELVLHYQPKVNLRSGQVIGMEALLRWQHPETGLVPPLEFLPHIEQSDLIVEIGEWVIDEVLRQSAEWAAAGATWPIGVNIAARHFQSPHFFGRLKSILARHPEVDAHGLDLEIVESAALGDLDLIRHKIRACQSLGVSFSLDDFGTGYSSLSYLKRLPAETLKIDQSFVRDILDDKEDLAVVEAVIGLATAFNRKVVAEGVETSEHGVLLMRLGCDCVQGYGIAKPMPAEQVPQWAATFTPDSQWKLWSGVRWALDDLPLLLAQYDHLNWVRRVVMTLEDIPMTMPAVEVSDHRMCRFGYWYYTHGQERYGGLAEFAAIEPIHIRMHQVGAEILKLHAAGDTATARVLCNQLLKLKDRILSMLSALQLAILQKESVVRLS